jgi:hypothetical protein
MLKQVVNPKPEETLLDWRREDLANGAAIKPTDCKSGPCQHALNPKCLCGCKGSGHSRLQKENHTLDEYIEEYPSQEEMDELCFGEPEEGPPESFRTPVCIKPVGSDKLLPSVASICPSVGRIGV